MRSSRIQKILAVLLCAVVTVSALPFESFALPERTQSCPAGAHTFGDPVWEWSDDCGSATLLLTCTSCGDTAAMFASITVQTVSILSCTTDEIVRYCAKATFGNETYTDVTDEIVLYTATGHHYEAPVWTWADDYGSVSAAFTCTVCGEMQSVQTDSIDETVVSRPDCETDSVVRYGATILLDGETYTGSTGDIVLSVAPGHLCTDPVWTWAQDFESATASFTCSRCGKTLCVQAGVSRRVIRQQRCTEGSVVTYTASAEYNGTPYTDTTGEVTLSDAPGHDFGDWTFWTEEVHRRVCVRCSETEYVAHDPEAIVTEPTCTDEGSVRYRCTACGYSYAGDAIPALGHAFGDWYITTAPTALYGGRETRICARCGQAQSRSIPPLTTGPTFRLIGETAHAGETIRVELRVDRNPGLISTLMELSYDPQVLTLTGVQNGEVFASDQLQLGGDLTAVPFSFCWVDALAAQDHAQDGVLLTFIFRVSPDAQAGSTTVSLTYDEESTLNRQLQSVAFEARGAELTTIARLAGDPDGSGTVDLKDVVLLRRFLAGGWDVQPILTNADVNADNAVDQKDIVQICRYLVGGWGVELI